MNESYNKPKHFWFLVTSYHYINPRGVIGHVKFMVDFPFAYWRYRKLMNEAVGG